ncbi:MAG TPA: phosphoribosyltransferase family protein [Dehalococcoidia bacterium]|nr:phosphoribosyltransferase family protein [Dehalococcoidia bacterium]
MRPLSQTGNLWLADTLWKLGAIEFGDFTLGRTAVHSPVYVNLRLLISKPAALQRAARVIREEVRTLQSMLNPQVAPFQLVAGVPFGGLHLATAYSLTAKAPLIYIRPQHADDVRIEGLHERGQTVLIVDDLITGGHSILDTAQQLRGEGLQVKDAVVLVDRQQGGRQALRNAGLNLTSLLTLEVILNYLMSSGKISEESYQRSLAYLEANR